MRNYDNNAQNNGKLILMKPVHMKYEVVIDAKGKPTEKKTKVTPYFQEKELLPDETGKKVFQIVNVDKPLSSITGNLTKVEVIDKRIKDNDGKSFAIREVKLTLSSPEVAETYMLTIPWGIPGRQLLNSVAGLQNFDDITISYYRNKKDYDTFSIKQNGEFVEGVTTYENLNGMTKKVVIDGQEQTDISELRAFLTEKLVALNERIQAGKTNTPVRQNAPVEEGEESLEIPF